MNTPMFSDNSKARKTAISIESISRAKHIDVVHPWFEQEVERESCKLQHVNTEAEAR
jgi:uncharacterized protein YacL (UPF0231 family)